MAAREWYKRITNLILLIVSGAGESRVYGERDVRIIRHLSQLNACVLIGDDGVRDGEWLRQTIQENFHTYLFDRSAESELTWGGCDIDERKKNSQSQ